MPEIGTCQRCGREARGRQHAFYYGKHSKTSVDPYAGPGGSMVVRHRYIIHGKATAFICGKCVAKARLLQFLMLLLGPALGALGCYIGYEMERHSTLYAGLHWILPTSLLLLSVVLICLWALATSQQKLPCFWFMGSELAVRAKRAQYEASGYDALFSPPKCVGMEPINEPE